MTVPSSQPQHLSVLQMAAPLVVSFWMRAAVTLVDTVYAALIGDAAVAAVGLTIPLEFLMIALWVGLSTGLTSNLSRAMGSHEHAKVAQYRRVAQTLVATMTPVFTLLGAGVWLAAPLMRLEPEVARSFQIYGTVLIAGSAFTTFWSIIPDSLIKAHHDTRSTMWAGIWSNVINVTLNTIFLFVFGWGLAGIALSTVLGRIGGLVYALVRARAHERVRLTEPGDRQTLDPAPYRALLNLAIPSSLTFALMATETGFINWLLSATDRPTEAIAAYSIYYRVLLFAFQPVIAISVAMLPYAARRLGAGDRQGVQRGLRQANLASVVYSLALIGPVMVLAGPWIAERLAESPFTAHYARFALYAVPLTCLASAPFLLYRPVFEAMQRGQPGLVMAAVRYVVLTGPLAWSGLALAEAMGLPGLYGVIAGTLVATSITSGLFHLWLSSTLAGGLRERPREATETV